MVRVCVLQRVDFVSIQSQLLWQQCPFCSTKSGFRIHAHVLWCVTIIPLLLSGECLTTVWRTVEARPGLFDKTLVLSHRSLPSHISSPTSESNLGYWRHSALPDRQSHYLAVTVFPSAIYLLPIYLKLSTYAAGRGRLLFLAHGLTDGAAPPPTPLHFSRLFVVVRVCSFHGRGRRKRSFAQPLLSPISEWSSSPPPPTLHSVRFIRDSMNLLITSMCTIMLNRVDGYNVGNNRTNFGMSLNLSASTITDEILQS